MLGVTIPREEYTYSRSVTVRTYAFLAGFSAAAWWQGARSPIGTWAESARFIFLIALAISVAFLWRWTHRRLRLEYLVLAAATLLLFPVLRWALGAVDGVGSDALNIGVFVVGMLAIFMKLPAPKEPTRVDR